jgi:hypothetical protein
MSLPLVIIFEQHWNIMPKLLVQDLLPHLAEQGYNSLCFEAPQTFSSDEIIQSHERDLEQSNEIERTAEKFLKQVGIIATLSDVSFQKLAELIRLYVSSQDYLKIAETIKQLPASRLLKNVFNETKKLSISIKGIDLQAEEFHAITTLDLRKRSQEAKKIREYRDLNLFENLQKLRREQSEGVVFLCGATHAKRLLAKFKEQNIQDDVLYYFVHSSGPYNDQVDEEVVKKLTKIDPSKKHTHLLTKQKIKPLSERIIKEIREKTRYEKEIKENSQAQFLSIFFQTHFEAHLRPGYYVDALLNFEDHSEIENIEKSFIKTEVPTYRASLGQKKYLIIPGINTEKVGNKIKTISR